MLRSKLLGSVEDRLASRQPRQYSSEPWTPMKPCTAIMSRGQTAVRLVAAQLCLPAPISGQLFDVFDRLDHEACALVGLARPNVALEHVEGEHRVTLRTRPVFGGVQ